MAGIYVENTLILGKNGSDSIPVAVDEDGNLTTISAPVNRTPVTTEDTSFVVGDSPATFNANAQLTRNGDGFSFYNDGAGDILVSISNDGVTYSDTHKVESEEVYSINGVVVHSIRATHTGVDSAYRIVVL